jgi:hypothetical protein
MNTQKLGAIAAVLALAAASVVAAQVRAGGDKVAFPENYAQGVMYYSFDRPDVKQYRETFVTPAAIDALKKDQPVPSGTVITTCSTRRSSMPMAIRSRMPTAGSSKAILLVMP